jgi:hypothetical protein
VLRAREQAGLPSFAPAPGAAGRTSAGAGGAQVGDAGPVRRLAFGRRGGARAPYARRRELLAELALDGPSWRSRPFPRLPGRAGGHVAAVDSRRSIRTASWTGRSSAVDVARAADDQAGTVLVGFLGYGACDLIDLAIDAFADESAQLRVQTHRADFSDPSADIADARVAAFGGKEQSRPGGCLGDKAEAPRR